MSYTDYSDKSVSMNKWLEEIAPKYFDFPAENIHRASQFGYMNEVMATIENDTHHAVSIARREFYPTTAKYLKSFYKMGALQRISYPMANPAVATAVLIIRQDDILKYGYIKNSDFISNDGGGDLYEFVLDNTMLIYAGSVPFMLDYPIRILAKKPTKVFTSNTSVVTSEYAYTVYYDTSKPNSLNTTTSKYIKSRVYKHAGETLLLIKVALRQCMLQHYSTGINTSPILNNISLEFPFSGDMCNFEVSYSEAYSDVSTPLLKLPLNSNPSSTEKFCMYSMDDKQTLRISFPENAWFTPKFNSTIDVNIYTTLGEKGNFSQYAGPLVCKPNSEDFPYNNLVSITGKIVGSSIGGYSFPNIEDFKNDVIAAYATNKTITTSQDLQIMFDSIAMDTRNRIIFDKRRDDVFERLYGAYMLIKDLNGHVIPTNSITGEVRNAKADVDVQEFADFDMVTKYDNGVTGIIKPGRIWQYHLGVFEAPIQEKNDDGTYKYVKDDFSTYQTMLDEYGEWLFSYVYANVNGEVKSLYQILKQKFGNYTIRRMLNLYSGTFTWLYDEVNGHPVFLTTTDEETGDIRYLTEMHTLDGRDHCISDTDREYTVYPTNDNLNTLLENEDDLLYTNPFLIRVNTARNVVGYYQTTFDTTIPMDMQCANSYSLVQFNITNLNVYRNAVAGENFYKISLQLQPSISDSNLASLLLVSPDEYGTNKDSSFVREIRAQFNGVVEKFIYIPGPRTDEMHSQLRKPGSVYMIIRYDTTLDSRSWTRYVNDSMVNSMIDTEHCIAIKISGGVEAYNEHTGRSQFLYTPWFDTSYRAGDTFMQGDIIAVAKSMDTGTLRVIAEIDDNENGILDGYYIPFTLDRYDETNDSYVYSAYLSTSDEITYNDQLVIDYGFFDIDGAALDTITIDPKNCHLRVSTFVKYDDMNVPQNIECSTHGSHVYHYDYCRGYTLTNVYENIEPFNLLKSFDFIRSVMTFQIETDDNYKPGEDGYIKSIYCRLNEIPLIRAGWMQNPGNVFDIFEILSNNYDYLYQIYDLLENNYSIDMKFFNTFGKSRYYMIGMKRNEDLNDLETVNVKLRFGIRVNQLTDANDFDERFTKYVNDYIESFNNIENQGKSIFIMDLITSIKNKFGDELEYIEYYGVNNWDADTSQVIESWPIDKIEALGYRKYIPEFINLYCTKQSGIYKPYVSITHVD